MQEAAGGLRQSGVSEFGWVGGPGWGGGRHGGRLHGFYAFGGVTALMADSMIMMMDGVSLVKAVQIRYGRCPSLIRVVIIVFWTHFYYGQLEPRLEGVGRSWKEAKRSVSGLSHIADDSGSKNGNPERP